MICKSWPLHRGEMMACEFCNLRLRWPDRVSVATYLPGATFGPRTMRDWEFVWLVEGDAEYRWESAEVEAPEGSVVLCRPGGRDFFTWDKQRRTRHAFFHFHIASIPGHWPAVAAWPFVRRPRPGDVIRENFRYLLTEGRSMTSPASHLAVMQMLAAFVFGDFDSGDVPRESLPQPVDVVLRLIRRRLDDDAACEVTLDEMAKEAGVRQEHLCRLFRTATKFTPAAAVRMARLDRAIVLLSRSNYAVGQISAMCGFENQFHFSRTFKAAFGHSPREMRKRIEAGQTPPVPLLTKWGRIEHCG